MCKITNLGVAITFTMAHVRVQTYQITFTFHLHDCKTDAVVHQQSINYQLTVPR